ncbi:MAG: hypothetical protein ACYCOY_10120 [Metallibacterium sp.]
MRTLQHAEQQLGIGAVGLVLEQHGQLLAPAPISGLMGGQRGEVCAGAGAE